MASRWVAAETSVDGFLIQRLRILRIHPGTNGNASRVTRWLVGDNSGASNTGSNSRGTNDFTGGSVDALVTR